MFITAACEVVSIIKLLHGVRPRSEDNFCQIGLQRLTDDALEEESENILQQTSSRFFRKSALPPLRTKVPIGSSGRYTHPENISKIPPNSA